MYRPFDLPKGFLLGSATSATQIEGGDSNNSWHRFCKEHGVADSSDCIRACGHYELYEKDISLMEQLGIKIYRMGIEWSRVEPSCGEFNEQALEHYKHELELLAEKNIKVLLTLHHFTNPLWFEDMGAFERAQNIHYFLRYVKYIIKGLGHLCTDYITINEPNVYAVHGYFFSIWPPAKKDPMLCIKVMKNMALAHIKSYALIHSVREQMCFSGRTMVGFANHLRIFHPKNEDSLIDKAGARIMQYIFQDAITAAINTGRFSPPFGIGAPLGVGRFYDFIGINYYTRSAVSKFKNQTMEDVPLNDLGWEIYPQGLKDLCLEQYDKYRAPIWITENGIADNDDSKRSAYIYSHLSKLSQLNIPVERYYHWSFIDNFEWAEGESSRFGLVHCDYQSKERSIKKSGEFYGCIIKDSAVTQESIDKYLKA